MALVVIATLDNASSGVFRAVLVLLVVLAVSVLVIRQKSRGVRAPMHEESPVEDLKSKEAEMFEEKMKETTRMKARRL